MKYLILASLVLSAQAFACSPQMPADAQLTNLQRILESSSFRKALQKAQTEDSFVSIRSININRLQVALTNGCAINSKLLWKPVSQQIPGMCPQFDKVVSKLDCIAE